MNWRSLILASMFAFTCVPVAAQVEMHSDFGGYSIRTGNSIYSYRDSGTTQEFHRFGNIGMYSDNAGTSGESFYFPSGRYDSYRNYKRGWSGDGYSPYGSTLNTYSRRNAAQLPPLPELPPLPALPTLPTYTTPQVGTSVPRANSLRGTRPSSVAPSTSTSSRLKRRGITLDESKFSQSELLDIESRVSCAQRIERKGVSVDWKSHSHSQLLDIESRVAAAGRIQRLGYRIDWQSKTHSDLLDIESRLSAAKRIERKGVSIDWKTHTHSQLLDIESRVGAAKRLARKNVIVDWKDYTHSQLLKMEYTR
ncbi:hypothetical protein [Crateriforma conspicua]|uniref:Uncharacterized protein n=1 Tax=Crateriforma conspicua TaxID=2527996 RepID=A0A5C5YB70_9PLAN|nr:hypothetical protein [Crateriforma conspicua]TWT72630.1 hypothetical protein Pan14r_49500 [Crateriforma conspicua]